MILVIILMIGAILWLFIDNHYTKQRVEILRERVRFLECYPLPEKKTM